MNKGKWYLLSTVLLIGCLCFLLFYGIKGLSAVESLIKLNKYDVKNLFDLIWTFYVTTISFVMFSAFLSFCCYKESLNNK